MRKTKGITLIALVITIVVLLILAGVTISTLTGDNGLISKANESKIATEKSALREEIDLLLLQAQMGDKIEDIFKDGIVIKDGTIYEVTYKGEKFLVSSDNEYIEIVEPSYEGEWTFNQSTQTLTGYNGDLTTKRENQDIGEVIIPNYYNGKRVKKISGGLFRENLDLKKLTISDGIEVIGGLAFYNCSNLKGDLIIPNSVTTIEMQAFQNCTSLDGILKLSNRLEKINGFTFLNCSSLKGNIEIPDSVISIDHQAFKGCGSFDREIILGKNLQTIGSQAFCGDSKLIGSLIIPDSVIAIGGDAFNGCSSLNGKVKLSANLEAIEANIFVFCNNLTGELIIPEKVTTYNGDGCQSFSSIKFLNRNTTIVDHISTIRPSIGKIIGYSGSTAQAYAEKYNRTFEIISE